METRPEPWIAAFRNSHDRLKLLVEPLDSEQLTGRSYDSEWSIAQVLSHLGSQSEIFDLYLNAGLHDEELPGQEVFGPIWDAWNARSPEAQAADGLQADAKILEHFESLDSEQRDRLHLEMFGMNVDLTMLARMRLGEHAVHTWDVEVSLHPTATLAPEAVELLVDTLDQLVGRVAKSDGTNRRVRVVTTDPSRSFVLEVGENVALLESSGEADLPELRLPAEELIRLVYGRLDPEHTSAAEGRGIDLDELRRIFPGV